jgi:hypothetical protein
LPLKTTDVWPSRGENVCENVCCAGDHSAPGPVGGGIVVLVCGSVGNRVGVGVGVGVAAEGSTAINNIKMEITARKNIGLKKVVR